jgi:hypothetical protein
VSVVGKILFYISLFFFLGGWGSQTLLKDRGGILWAVNQRMGFEGWICRVPVALFSFKESVRSILM